VPAENMQHATPTLCASGQLERWVAARTAWVSGASAAGPACASGSGSSRGSRCGAACPARHYLRASRATPWGSASSGHVDSLHGRATPTLETPVFSSLTLHAPSCLQWDADAQRLSRKSAGISLSARTPEQAPQTPAGVRGVPGAGRAGAPRPCPAPPPTAAARRAARRAAPCAARGARAPCPAPERARGGSR